MQSLRKISLAPVVDDNTHVLILGSLPGEASLAAQQYYGHPRNHFWPLMEQVTGEPLTLSDYEERLERLKCHRIGLWDTVASAERQGSLDQDIRAAEHNDLMPLIDTLPHLRAIAFNGTKAAQIGMRQIDPDRGLDIHILPSSSPARAVPLAEKALAWRVLQRYCASN
jgi:double-stranded uracil-DNA glycosylase